MNTPNLKNVGSLVSITTMKGKAFSGEIIENDGQFITLESIDDNKRYVIAIAYIVFFEEYIPKSLPSENITIDRSLDNLWPEAAMGTVGISPKGNHLLFIYNGTKPIKIPKKLIIDDFSKGDKRVVFCQDNNKIIYVRKLGPYSKFLLDAENEKDVNPKRAMAIIDMVLSLCPNNGSANLLKKRLEEPFRKAKIIEEGIAKFDEHIENEMYDNAFELITEQFDNKVYLPVSLISRLYRKVRSDKSYKNRLFSIFTTYEDIIIFADVKKWLNVLLKEKDYSFLYRFCHFYMNNKNKNYDNYSLSMIYYYLAESYYGLDKPEDACSCVLKSMLYDCCNERSVIFLCESLKTNEGKPINTATQKYVDSILNKNKHIVGVKSNWKENTAKALQDISHVLAEKSCEENYNINPEYFFSYATIFKENCPGANSARLYFAMAKYFYYKSVELLHNRQNIDTIKDYCLASIDISRSLYNEPFAEMAFLLYLNILIEENNDNLNDLSTNSIKQLSLDDTFHVLTDCDFDITIWQELFKAGIPSSHETVEILNNAYISSKDEKNASILPLWNECQAKYTKIENDITNLIALDLNNISVSQIRDLLNSVKDLLFSQDTAIIDDITSDFLEDVETLKGSTDIESAKKTYNNLCVSVYRIYKTIQANPTLHLCGYVMPILDKIKEMIENDYAFVKEQSFLSLDLSIESQTAIGQKGNISIQLRTTSVIGSSPMRNIKISIENSDYFTCNEIRNSECDGLNAGEHYITHLQLHLVEEAVKEKAVSLNGICTYENIDNDKYEKEFSLSINLFSDDDFVSFENKYFRNGGTGLTESDLDMFYGRDNDLNEVSAALESTSTCHYAIYGQKRSGKSSFMNILASRLNKTGKYFCVYWSLTKSDYTPNANAFFYAILRHMKSCITRFNGERPEFECPTKKEFCESEDSAKDMFLDYISAFKINCQKYDNWKDKKIVIMIDEFTELYNATKRCEFPDTFLQDWKSIAESEGACISSIFCGHDTFPMWLSENYAANAGRILVPKRLDYLKRNDAVDLVVKPILDADGNSRYTGKSVELILEYTSCNPYYIQIFCKELVNAVLERKSNRITEADVLAVASKLINGECEILKGAQAFENLTSCGEAKNLGDTNYYPEYPEDDIIHLLRTIARTSTIEGVCKKTDIEHVFDKPLLDKYLNNLKKREVIEITYSDILKMDVIKIKVKLFSKWLQKN